MMKKDDLLGIPSRAQLDEDLRQRIGRSDARHPLSLLFIDLDLFKEINDLYGHEAGDEVLVKAGQVLESVSRGKGDSYRRSGDELAVLLPNHSLHEAEVVAEQIRAAIEQMGFEHCPEKMTASIGIASYPETVEDPTRLFSLADTMMYRAKDNGGNCICTPLVSMSQV